MPNDEVLGSPTTASGGSDPTAFQESSPLGPLGGGATKGLDDLPAAGVLWPSLSAPYRCKPFTEGSNWGAFFRYVCSMTGPYRGKNSHPGWSPCVLRPPAEPLTKDGKPASLRLDELIEAMSALVIDCDESTSLDDMQRVWGSYVGLCHTTRKHRPEAPRCRAILPFTRNVTCAEYALIWNWGANVSIAGGIMPDFSTRNVSRFWYLPGANTLADWKQYHEECLEREAKRKVREKDAYVPVEHPLVTVTTPGAFLMLRGAVLDVDALLERIKSNPEIAKDQAPATVRAAEPDAAPAKEKKTKPKGSGKPDDAFAIANKIPIKDVAEWLGILKDDKLTCPGCSNTGTKSKTDVAFVQNGLKCSHNTCAKRGVPGNPGFRSVVDLVMEVQNITAGQALSAVTTQFNVVVPPFMPAGFPTYTPDELTFAMGLETRAGWSVLRVLESNFQDVLQGRVLATNEMNDKVWIGDEELTPEETTVIRDRIEEFVLVPKQKGKGLERMHVPREVLEAELRRVARANKFHPVRDYLRSITWDGARRIEHVCADILHVGPSVLHQAMIKKFFISAVARPMEPGCKVDTVLVLIGLKQGEGKSSFFRELTNVRGEQSKRWFSDSTVDIHNKDAFLNLSDLWIQEWAELETMLRARDAASSKSFITSGSDLYRAPYDTVARLRPRSCVIAATTNRSECLSDERNRRWWPIEVDKGSIDIQLLREWRDQLWAEAVALYDAKEEAEHLWWFNPEEEALLVLHNQIHQESSAWEAPLLSWAFGHGRPFTTGEIMVGALCMDTKDLRRADEMRVAAILRVAGFVRGRKHACARTWELPPDVEIPAEYRPQLVLDATKSATSGDSVWAPAPKN